MTIDVSLLDRDIELIRQKRGPDAIRMGNTQIDRERIVLPFPTLMRITSGGIPIGCVVRVHGGPSSGKTQLSYNIIREAQNHRSKRFPKGMNCCYWNVEAQFDKNYVASLGVDTDELVLMETDVIEDIAEAMEVLLTSVHLHVIDSASFATPADELAAKPGDWQRALHARAWKRAINRIHHRMDKDSNTIVIIDHEAMNMQGFSEPLSGQRMAYRSDLSIQMSRGAWLFYDKYGELVTNDKLKEQEANKLGMGASGQKEADGQEVSIRIPKSRVCRPNRGGKMRLDLHKMRFDTAFELAQHAEFLDLDGLSSHRSGNPSIARMKGSWYTLPEWNEDKKIWEWGDDKKARKAHGMRGLRTEIEQDERLQKFIMETMLLEG